MSGKKVPMKQKKALTWAIILWLSAPLTMAAAAADGSQSVTTKQVVVQSSQAEENAKWESQQVQIITAKEIEEKQAKSVEDVIFNQTGVSKTVDAMGRTGVSIRGAEPRHTLILIDGQPVMGDLAKYSGAMDEVMRLGTENVDHIEVIQGAASAKYGSDAIGGVINIITKKASATPQLQVNAESMRAKGDKGLAPYTNLFLRADSGQIGKLRLGVYGSKRDIMPVYASEKPRRTWIIENKDMANFEPNALRYHGTADTIGMVGTYDINENNSLHWNVERYTEDLLRHVKHTDSDMEPQQIFKRRADRNTYNLGWTGRAGRTDWSVETNYSRMKEDDISLINYYGRSSYEGKNELKYVDDVDHRQRSLKASANTQINDRHLLSYGVGFIKETGEGSRLKSSPRTSTRYIDPWDYDKSLLVEGIDAYMRNDGDTSVPVWSHIHDYAFYDNGTSLPQWDQNYEYYGADRNDPSTLPLITYTDYERHKLKDKEPSRWYNDSSMTDDKWKDYWTFEQQLRDQNPQLAGASNIVGKYFEWGMATDPKTREKAPVFNGRHFLEEYRRRNNRITTGRGTINRRNFFIQDTWQVNDRTIVTPILRLDDSSLFGSHLSGNLGLTHNVGGNEHRRFKANIGTGYTEPGMGELWYNWEMYGSSPVGIGVARMGWYWVGNPDLKPETSVNFDIGIEGENDNTSARLGFFHNRIKDYMTVYFTGRYMDFAPDLGFSAKWMRAPDLIYSFKNIGRAEITGLEAEVKQKLGCHWTAKLGYTWLHAINKSDSDMPRRLLDKPVHKVDIGLDYDDPASGWRGSLWGNYYIHMLDSNSLSDSSNYWPDILQGEGAVYRKPQYQKKTFGIWNLMVQKKLNKDSLVYFGINNLFNHRDDDRATQQRVYRFGVNFKLGRDARDILEGKKAPAAEGAGAAKTPVRMNDFIARPFDESKGEGWDIIGDYRLRWDSHKGQDRQLPPFRADTYIDTADRNMYDRGEHGFSQRLRLGVDARLGEDTNLRLLGSASGSAAVDTAETVPLSEGLQHQRVEEADLTHRVSQWDFSIGRLTEPMGVTGYWFGKEFDGVRAVWTGKDAQVRLGYGSFKHSTGISDSAYTHSTHVVFYRPPTVSELIGLNRDDWPYDLAKMAGTNPLKPGTTDPDREGTVYDEGSPNDIYNKSYKGKNDKVYFYQQLRDAVKNGADTKEQGEVIRRLQHIVNTAYGKDAAQAGITLNVPIHGKVLYRLKHKDTGAVVYKAADVYYNSYISDFDSPEEKAYKQEMNKHFSISLSDDRALGDGRAFLTSREAELHRGYEAIAEHTAKEAWGYYGKDDEMGTTYRPLDGNGMWRNVSRSDRAGDYVYDGIEDIGSLDWKDSGQDGAGWYSQYRFDSTLDHLIDELYKENYGSADFNGNDPNYGLKIPRLLSEYLKALEDLVRSADSASKQPRAALEKAIGRPILTEGTILRRDVIAPLDRAAFVQVKKQFGPDFGLQAWYFHSFRQDKQPWLSENNHGNDVDIFDRFADVVGIGARWQIGQNLRLSADYGQNRTEFGRFLNGQSRYDHQRGTADFTLLGRDKGGTPHFWTVRLDVGRSDTDVPGSWNAFADYKYFQHGSFFGGNGTESLPDRYLDGIRSFTVGAGYVPAKNLLVEAFYTFDAKGIHNRDTLYGPEQFTLGDYARLQLTYKF